MRNTILLALVTCALSSVANATDNDLSGLPEDNVGYLFASNTEMASAVMLDSEHVLTCAHSTFLYEQAMDQVFIKGTQFCLPISQNINGAYIDFQEGLKHLKLLQTPVSRYDVIRLPQKVPHQVNGVYADIDDKDVFNKAIKSLFDCQNNILELLKEDKGIDGFTYPEGDWSILKLKNKIPVQPLCIQKFSPIELSGKNSVCLGMQKELDNSQKYPVIKITSNKVNINPEYHKDRNLFFSTIYTLGAQDDTGLPVPLPTSFITSGMSGGPVFFQLEKNKWVLGGIVSTNLCDRMLVQLAQLSQDTGLSIPTRQNLKKLVAFYKNQTYGMHTLYPSLDGLFDTCQQLNISLNKK